jgi:PspA-Associated protein
MIVRILGEGQFDVDDTAAAELNDLDTELASAVERGDEEVFRRALNGLLARVRAAGKPVPADSLEPSGLILPHEDADLAEVRKLMTDEGFIPG